MSFRRPDSSTVRVNAVTGSKDGTGAAAGTRRRWETTSPAGCLAEAAETTEPAEQVIGLGFVMKGAGGWHGVDRSTGPRGRNRRRLAVTPLDRMPTGRTVRGVIGKGGVAGAGLRRRLGSEGHVRTSTVNVGRVDSDGLDKSPAGGGRRGT